MTLRAGILGWTITVNLIPETLTYGFDRRSQMNNWLDARDCVVANV